jgi:hypothetical protein
VKEEPEDDWDQVAEAEIREANRYSQNFSYQVKDTDSANNAFCFDLKFNLGPQICFNRR